MALLEVKNLHKNFGKLQAVSGLSFTVNKGEIHGLIQLTEPERRRYLI